MGIVRLISLTIILMFLVAFGGAGEPTSMPSNIPTSCPTVVPSSLPTSQPTGPSGQPTGYPTTQPTSVPSSQPTAAPSSQPTGVPSSQPTGVPSSRPSSSVPTAAPTSSAPTVGPTSSAPTSAPTTSAPTSSPSSPSSIPSGTPTSSPSIVPSGEPSTQPTGSPTSQPSAMPSGQPSGNPTEVPTSTPSHVPSFVPSSVPTSVPTTIPTKEPGTSRPTWPGATNFPTAVPTTRPSLDVNDYDGRLIQQAFAADIAGLDDDPATIGYASFYYKGIQVAGTCEEWGDFRFGDIILPFDNAHFGALRAVFEDQEWFGDKSNARLEAQCDEREKVRAILDAFQFQKPVDVSCGGHSWRVIECGQQGFTAFCVDCVSACNRCPGFVTGDDQDDNHGDGFIISPCNQDCASFAATPYAQTAATAVLRLDIEEDQQYPVFLYPLEVSVAKNNLTISSGVSRAGMVSCLAISKLKQGIIESATLVRQMGQTVSVSDAGANFSITVTRLAAGHEHSIFCYTEDFNGQTMPFDVVKAQSVLATTLGTPEVRLTAFHEFLPVSENFRFNDDEISSDSDYAIPYIYEFEADPSDEFTQFEVLLYDCLGNRDPDGVEVNPELINYDISADIFFGKFSFLVTEIMCFKFSLRRKKGFRYTSTLPIMHEVQVMELDFFTETAPEMRELRLSNDGSRVVLSFDKDTDRANKGIVSFKCNEILSLPGGFGSTMCIWQSDSRLSILLDGNEAPEKAAPLPDTIASKCTNLRGCTPTVFVSVTEIMMLAPLQPPTPLISLSMPKKISHCESLGIDPTGSSRNGGRPWAAIEWSVELSSSGGYNATALERWLNEYATDTTGKLIEAPSNLLPFIGTYTISLRLRNHFGISSVTSRAVEVSGANLLPIVSIIGPSMLQRYSWQELSLFATAAVSSCNNEVSLDDLPPLEYTWKIYKELKNDGTIDSTSKDKRAFKLPAYTLEPGAKYTVDCTVIIPTGETNPPRSSSTVTILVGRSGIKARFAGAAERTVSSQVLNLIDASSSYDIDDPSRPSTEFSFVWSCLKIAPIYGVRCGGFFRPTWPSVGFIGPNAWTTSDGTGSGSYNFSVTVYDGLDGSKFDTASVIINVRLDHVPSIILDFPLVKYNPHQKIIITSQVSNPEGPANLNWTSLQLGSDLEDKVESSLTPVTLAGESQVALALKPGVLSAGASYQFMLSGRYAEAPSGTDVVTSTITIVVNEPPIGGTMSVSPAVGVALNTTFHLQTQGWRDDPDDFPLTYSMTTYTFDPDQRALLKGRGEVTYLRAFLNQGFKSSDPLYKVFCTVHAFDVFNSSSSYTTSVVVKPPSVGNITELTKSIDTLLSTAQREGSVEGVNQILDATTQYLNERDCIGVTRDNCTRLRRRPCSTTTSTCGNCLPGYLGVDGHANSPCLLELALFGEEQDGGFRRHRRLDADQLLAGVAEAPCARSGECLSGVCCSSVSCAVGHQTCDGADCKCTQGFKTCPGDCTSSSHGECIFHKRLHSNTTACLLEDTLCVPKCSCHTGWYGRDCSLNQAEYNASLVLRNTTCAALFDVTTKQDVDLSVLKARASTVESILHDMDQISPFALHMCGSALTQSVEAYPALSGDDEVVAEIMSALSAIMNGEEHFSGNPTLYANVLSAITAVTAGRQIGHAVGDRGTEMVMPNLRFLTQKHYAGELTSTMSPPRDTFERYYGHATTNIDLDVAHLSPTDIIGVTLVELMTGARGRITNSSKVWMSLHHYAESASSSDVTATFDLLNFEPQMDYSNEEPDIGVIRCENSEQVYNESITVCPHPMLPGFGPYPQPNPTFNFPCPGGMDVDGWFNQTFIDYVCPVTTRLPKCLVWSPSDEEYNELPMCELKSFSETRTVCECTFETGDVTDQGQGHRRLAVEGASNYYLEVSSTALNVLHPVSAGYSTVLRQSPQFRDFSPTTALGMAATVVVFLLLFVYTDFDDLKSMSRREYEKPNRRLNVEFFQTILPTEMASGGTLLRMLSKSLQVHSVLSLLLPLDKDNLTARSFRWLCAVLRIFVLVAVHSYVCTTFYADDGSCENRFHYEDCMSPMSMDYYFGLGSEKLCAWKRVSLGGSYCTLKEPDAPGKWILLAMVMTAIVSVPINRFANAIAREASKIIMAARKWDPEQMQIKFHAEMNFFDQLEDWQTEKATYLRAARLAKMQQYFDFSPVEKEMEVFLEDVRNQRSMSKDLRGGYERGFKKSGGAIEESQAENLGLYTALDQMPTQTRSALKHKLEQVRVRCRDFVQSIEAYRNAESIERILVAYFLTECHPMWHQRKIAHYFMIHEHAALDLHPRVFSVLARFELILYVSLLLVMVAASGHYSYVVYPTLGSRALQLWSAAVTLSIVVDLLVLQPVKIYSAYIAVASYVWEDIVRVHYFLSRRAKLILRRTQGMMRDYNSRSMHYNVACRAARFYPHLPLARVLMSVGDYEFNAEPQATPIFIIQLWKKVLYGLALLVLGMLDYMPVAVRPFIIDLAYTTLLSIAAYAVYNFYQWNAAICIVTFVLLLVVVVFATTITQISSEASAMRARQAADLEAAREADAFAIAFHKKMMGEEYDDIANKKGNEETKDKHAEELDVDDASLSSNGTGMKMGLMPPDKKSIGHFVAAGARVRRVIGSPIGEVPNNRSYRATHQTFQASQKAELIPVPALALHHGVAEDSLVDPEVIFGGGGDSLTVSRELLRPPPGGEPEGLAPAVEGPTVSLRVKRRQARAAQDAANRAPDATSALIQSMGMGRLLQLGLLKRFELSKVLTLTLTLT